MFSDLRIAVRSLSKTPGFAIIAIATLAIGIAASTTIFSALRAIVLNPFDYPESDRLTMVWSGNHWPLSSADFRDLREQSQSFSEFGAYSPTTFNIGGERAKAVSGARTTHATLRALGVKPQLGRWFDEADDLDGAPIVAIISNRIWRQTFNGDLEIIGKSIRLDGGSATIVGVMPPKFDFVGPWIQSDDLDIWVPLQIDWSGATRDRHWLCSIARLQPGISAEAADTEIKAIGARLSDAHPNSNTNKRFLVRSLYIEMTREIAKHVWFLFAAVAMVLLVACANVASMLLARATKRQGEFGIRVALGATRGNLARLALTESLALALAGAFVGIMLAFGGIEIIRAISPVNEARKAAMSIDGVTLLFSLAATFLTTLLAGLPPIFSTIKSSVATIIRDDARGSVGSRSRHFMLRGLVIAQIAVAFLLANGAALFSASYFKLLEENKNVSSENVISAKVNLNGEAYEKNEDTVIFWNRLVAELESRPEILSSAITSKMPLGGGNNTDGLVNDETFDPTQKRINIERTSITADYFETMGLTLHEGRDLLPEDDMMEDGRMGIVVNREMVRRAWPDKDPLGQIVRSNSPDKPWFTATVVGVVEDVKQWGAQSEVQAEMYTTPKSHWGNRLYIVARSAQSATSLGESLSDAVASIDSELAIEDTRTLKQIVLDSTTGQRAMANIINFFMAIALGLVAVGLYGTLSYHILQRTREIGVRMAIGAFRIDIARLVFAQGARWVSIGVAIGIIGVFAISKVLVSLVYGMDGITPKPVILATLAICVAAFLAVSIPAKRAAGLAPQDALRGD